MKVRDREGIVNAGMNFGRQPLDLRVAHFGSSSGVGTERSGSNPGLSQAQDAFAFDDAVGPPTGGNLDLDSATLSAVLDSECLLPHLRNGTEGSHQPAAMDLSSILAASIGMLPVSVAILGCRYEP